MIFDLVFGLIFVCSLLFVGIKRAGHVRSENQYLLANRKAPLFSLTATLVMTELNSATLISFASVGYFAGPWGLSLPSVFFFGLIFYALSVAKKWKGFDGVSVASFFTQRYGSDIGKMASGALLLAMCGFSAVYVKSITLLFAPFFPTLSPWILSLLLVVFVVSMALRGGLISIIRTDVVSFLVALVFFPLLAFFAYRGSSSREVLVVNGPAVLPPKLVLSFIFLNMATYILAPWYGQKIFAAKNEKTAYFSVLISAFFVFAFYGLATLATWYFRRGGGSVAAADGALAQTIMSVLPVGLRGIGIGMLFAASATTLTGVWSAMSTLIVGDFLKPLKTESYQRSMFLSVGFALISYLLANLFVDRVFDKLLLANIPIAALSFALLAGFYWKGVSRVGVICSIIMGWIVGIAAYLYFGEAGMYTWYWAVWGLPTIFITGVLGSIVFPDKSVLKV